MVARWFLISRLAIAAIGVIGVATFVDHRTGTTENTLQTLNPEAVWHKWDSLWYERIARHGYGHDLDTPQGQAAAGFFPLYPAVVGLVLNVAPSLSFFWVAAALSNLFTLAALLLIVWGLMDRADQITRVLAIVMTSAGSFYLSIPYTEGLFLLLVAGTMVAARRGHFEVAGLLAGLSATTRVQGLALAAVPILACWMAASLTPRARWTRLAASATLFALPVVVYFTYLAGVQGSWAAFVTRQELWDNPTPYPFQALLGLMQFPTRISGWLHGGFWLLYLGLLARSWRRLPLGEALFCLGALLVSTQQESFHGIYRYTMVLVPLTLALAEDRQDVRIALIAINLVFGAIMILAFVTNNRLTV